MENNSTALEANDNTDANDAMAVRFETVKRGFFEVVINSGEPRPLVTLDVSMLPAHVQQLLAEAKGVLQDAMDLEVDSQEMYDYGAEQRRLARDQYKALEEARTAITGRIDNFKEAAMVVFRGDKSKQDGPAPTLKQATDIYSQKLIAYEQEVERKRKEEEARERARQEAERKRIEEEQRQQREEAERRQAALRAEAEEAARAGDDAKVGEIVRTVNAIQEEAEVRTEELASQANMLRSAPVVTHTPPVRRAAGFGTQTKWKCRVVDKEKFLRGVLEGRIPKAYATWDQSGLDKQASLLKGDLDYPGCEAYEDKGGYSR